MTAAAVVPATLLFFSSLATATAAAVAAADSGVEQLSFSCYSFLSDSHRVIVIL